jgi:hypothetical protein
VRYNTYGERIGAYRRLMGIPEGKRLLGRKDVDGKIIQQRSFKKWNGGMDLFDLGQRMDMWPVLM